LVEFKDGKVELKRSVYKCKFCNKTYSVYLKNPETVLMECAQTGKLFYTNAGYSQHPFGRLHSFFTNHYTIPWEKSNFLKTYELFKSLIKKDQCNGDWIIIFSAGICSYCGSFDKGIKPIKEDTLIKNQKYIPLIEFIPLRKIDDLPTKELKEIFKDFNFKYWNNMERNQKRNQEDWLKKHGIK